MNQAAVEQYVAGFPERGARVQIGRRGDQYPPDRRNPAHDHVLSGDDTDAEREIDPLPDDVEVAVRGDQLD